MHVTTVTAAPLSWFEIGVMQKKQEFSIFGHTGIICTGMGKLGQMMIASSPPPPTCVPCLVLCAIRRQDDRSRVPLCECSLALTGRRSSCAVLAAAER